MSRAPFWLRCVSVGIDVVLFTILQAFASSAAYVALGRFPQWVPPLVGVNEALAERTEELHETLATAGYFLIGLHALAALFHHYVQRDNTLKRMSF